ncbi:calpain, putative [Anopheles sinensis]|uniref:Calpain, putative n=1 Tax=Anopheles sinensis TaxID=74873 RepID=A0A084WJ01_ANOSI|nr:calpain, putative [Anopheles sinensis]
MPIVTRAVKKPAEVNGSKAKGAAVVKEKTEAGTTLHQSKSKFYPVKFDNEGIYFLKPNPNDPPLPGVQEYYRLRAECLSKGTLFEDPDFPADETSIHLMPTPCNHSHYKWLRPQEINPNAIFANEGFSRFAVKQGALGDCWLLAAAANLTIFPQLFHRVVPDDNDMIRGGRVGVDYAGIFHFRFWRFGQWYDVVIDDRLPTKDGRLVYIQSSQNEFWSALLEKAYAKLFGTYEALVGGSASEAMEDFTGGVTEMYKMQDAPENLYDIIEHGCNAYAMFACSLKVRPGQKSEDPTPEGLITGHAYSITKAMEVDIKTPKFQGKVKLLRLRNPWGNEAEWNGAWSDQSSEWKFIDEATKQKMGLTFENDGEFWMSFADFKKQFDKIEMCHLTPDCPIVRDSQGRFKWKTSAFEGEWVRGSTAGGCTNFMDTFWRNPQYLIDIAKPEDGQDQSTVIVSLIQKNRRSKRNKGIDCLSIGYVLYKVDPNVVQQQKPLTAEFFRRHCASGNATYINLRENTNRYQVEPGTYVIVPSTFEQNQEGEFMIRVFSETPNNMLENDTPVGVNEPKDIDTEEFKKELVSMEKLFHDVAGEDGEVDWMELKMLLDRAFESDIAKAAEGITKLYTGKQKDQGPVKQEIMLERAYLTDHGFSKDACRSMVAMLDEDGSGKLGFSEFQKLLNDIARWKAIFKEFDFDHNGHLSPFELRSALESVGFTLNNHIINKLMHRYCSKEGQIWFDDFITCAVKIRTMFDIFNAREKNNKNEISFKLEEWISQTIYS